MEELDYQPRKNRPGPKPRMQFKPGISTGNIGLIVVGRTLELLQHPLYTQLLASIGTELRREGLHLVLDEMLTSDQVCASVKNRHLDGALILSTEKQPAASLRLLARSLPIVHILASEHGETSIDHVTVDHLSIGDLAFRYLAGQGLDRFAFVNTESFYHGALIIRGRAFGDVARQAGYTVQTFGTLSSEWDIGNYIPPPCHTAATTPELIQKLAECFCRPFGLFLPTEDQALEVYPLLLENGLPPGQDITVVTTGNVEAYLARLSPRPASIDLGLDQIAAVAVKRLMERLQDPAIPALCIQIPPRLVRP